MTRNTIRWKILATLLITLVVCVAAVSLFWLHRRTRLKIAVIPRTCGTVLWEGEHVGAAQVAHSKGLEIYWNAPLREDDVQGQIELVNRVMQQGMAGLILTPTASLPLRTTVNRLLEKERPVVVVASDLGLEPGRNLAYVLSDEEKAGQMAARHLGGILHGQGRVALVGINHGLTSTAERAQSLEVTLAREFPKIQVVYRSQARMNASQEQEAVEKLLAENAGLDGIVAFNETATRGSYYALLDEHKAEKIHLIGFDQDMLSQVNHGGVDALIFQDTNRMGAEAMRLMDAELHGASHPDRVVVPPFLVTRETVNSSEMRRMMNIVWFN